MSIFDRIHAAAQEEKARWGVPMHRCYVGEDEWDEVEFLLGKDMSVIVYGVTVFPDFSKQNGMEFTI